MSIKLKLIDNDYAVCADTDIELEGGETTFKKFLKQINEELVIGNTACLEIDNTRFEISKAE
ncbi:MAG: hypothetical protein PVG39_15425 [Desulfobacteraceae bacterium]|jgi:hypothetical protein